MSPYNTDADRSSNDSATIEPLIPRSNQIDFVAKFDAAIWGDVGSSLQTKGGLPFSAEKKGALAVAPVAGGKTLILVMLAVMAIIQRFCRRVIIVSRSLHIAKQSLETLQQYNPNISGGIYSGSTKELDAQIIFATAQTLARHIEIVHSADLVLIDEADQAYLRDETKEYAAILKVARRYAGVTGTPFVLEKGRTVPIFGPGKVFDAPCYSITKAALAKDGYFRFIESAPIKPSRILKIERNTKVDLGGDFDTKAQACGAPMLSAIAADTKAAMDLLEPDGQFLFFGLTTEQCDLQAAEFNRAGLNVASYHNKLSAAEQLIVILHFRSGQLQGLCTVSKVNRGFDCPSIALVVIGFGTASRAKYEQMCGRAQRWLLGKSVAWVLDYGGHGLRFGSPNWDWAAAIEFDRREKLRIPAAELAARIERGERDPKCEVRPDNFMDFSEGTLDLFNVVVIPAMSGNGVNVHYAHSLGYSVQYLHAGTKWSAWVLRLLGDTAYAPPPVDIVELQRAIETASLPSHIILRRIYDDFRHKTRIAVVGFRRAGTDYIFDKTPLDTPEAMCKRAHARLAYGEAAE